jgi:demethylmenaquinone methyltransferase/2-methoxy-6-polyprenyl-1,4-benzoquinol methylase
MSDSVSIALAEQREYYEARASEYDEWWLRKGRYDRGAAENHAWFDDIATLETALSAFEPRGRILELAGGTGLWSEKLLPYAQELTVVDGSPESLRRNRARLGAAAVRYIEGDLFAWRPERRFDVVFFSFWLSHVPDTRFRQFWQLVESCLAPGGRVFFIDSVRQQASTSVDQSVPSSGDVMARTLNDGRSFRVFKIYYDPAALERRLVELGWRAHVWQTSRYFIVGTAERATG